VRDGATRKGVLVGEITFAHSSVLHGDVESVPRINDPSSHPTIAGSATKPVELTRDSLYADLGADSERLLEA
jgi:hypothetical protein